MEQNTLMIKQTTSAAVTAMGSGTTAWAFLAENKEAITAGSALIGGVCAVIGLVFTIYYAKKNHDLNVRNSRFK